MRAQVTLVLLLAGALALGGCSASSTGDAVDDTAACDKATTLVASIADEIRDAGTGTDALTAVAKVRTYGQEIGRIVASPELDSALEDLSEEYVRTADVYEEALQSNDFDEADATQPAVAAAQAEVVELCR